MAFDFSLLHLFGREELSSYEESIFQPRLLSTFNLQINFDMFLCHNRSPHVQVGKLGHVFSVASERG